MRKMRFVIVEGLFLCILMHRHGCDPLCLPCEEHTQCKILFEYQTDGSEVSYLIWKLDGIEKAICYATGKMECLPYPGTDENLKFWIYGEAGNITTEVIVSNATRAGDTKTQEKRWELFAYDEDGSSKLIYTCDFKMYNQVKDAVCNYEASEKGLRLTCIVSSGYPKRACLFNFNLDGLHFPHTSGVTYRDTFNQDLFTYITECYVDIPIATLIPGRLYYNISISPDIKMVNKVQKAGVYVKANISIEMPKLYLANCPDILQDTIQEAVIVNCVCARNDSSDIKTLMNWSTLSIDVQQFERFVVLQAIQKDTDYMCTARNDFGWTTFIKYRPSIKDSSRKQLGCPKEKPYNCSVECYSDNEFCLHGEVYDCVSANFTTRQEWCRLVVHSDGITSHRCKIMCDSHLPSSHAVKNEYNTVIFVLTICSIVLISVACVLLCLCNFRKRKKEVKLSEVRSIIYLKNDTKYNHNHGQKNLKDVTATCNKQPEETDSYEESSVDQDVCSEVEKHKNFNSCAEFVNNLTQKLKQYNESNENETVEKFILCTIDLTVKLTVGYVSKNGPHNDRLSKQRGKSFTFTGTGRVFKVNKSDKPCNCSRHTSQVDCSKWNVYIATTTHVVYDEEEAKCTTVELFDDEDKSGAKIKSLQGERFHETDRPGECVVQCETCDEDLSEKLASALTEQRELSKHLPFNNDTFFVVSHPHGKSKHICFGRRSQVKDCSDVTCPGCFGASILMLHSESSQVHRGVNGKGNVFSTTGPPEKIPLLRPLKEVAL